VETKFNSIEYHKTLNALAGESIRALHPLLNACRIVEDEIFVQNAIQSLRELQARIKYREALKRDVTKRIENGEVFQFIIE